MMSLRRLAAVTFVASAVFAAAASSSAATVAYTAFAPTSTQVVTGTAMAALADRIAKTTINDPDRTVVPAFSLPDQSVPKGTLAIATLSPQINPTYIAVPIQIVVDGRMVRSVVAGYRVQQYVHTAVAAHDLVPGAILTSDDLTLQRVISNGRPATDIGSLVGRRVRSATSRGTLMYMEATAVNELVKSGAGVILIVRDGPVALTADVIARTGGGLGETVTVYNAKTNKILSGTVIGQDRVELVLPGENE